MERWKPNVTVAAVVERDGRFLLVKEHTVEGIRYNQPAGHLEPDESLIDAVRREALEETGWHVEPEALLGIYQARAVRADITYLRFAFICRPVSAEPDYRLDQGIIEALWMTPAEIDVHRDMLRSPSVRLCIDDYLAGERFPLGLIHTISR